MKNNGVRYSERNKMWVADITIQNKKKYLGYFKNKEDAIHAREEAERKYGYS